MKHFKRPLAAALALTMVSAAAATSAFAETVVDDTNDPAPQSAGFNVKYTYEAVVPTYTVTIPAGVTLSDSEIVEKTITVEDVTGMDESDKKIVITLDEASNDNDDDYTFNANNGDSNATYTIKSGSWPVKVGDTLA